jgi:DNA-binding transcriptional LysR family regulator
MTVDLDALGVLDAIARKGSFAGAAAELCRVRSAVSYSIQKLEETLDVKLFDRSGHRAVLTAEGRLVLEQGRNLLDSANAFKRRIKNISQGWESEFTLAISVLLPIEPILQCIDSFYQLGHQTNIRILREAYAGTWDALETKRADLVVGASGEIHNGYNTFSLGELKRVFAVSPDHPLAAKPEPLTEEDMSDFQSVSLSDTARILDRKHASYLKGQVTLSVADVETKVLAQSMGLGGGLLPKLIAEKAEKKGKLKIKKVESSNINPFYYMAWPKGQKGNTLKWFINALKQPLVVENLLNN